MNDAPRTAGEALATETPRRPQRSKGGLPSVLGAIVDVLSSTKLTVVLLVILHLFNRRRVV